MILSLRIYFSFYKERDLVVKLPSFMKTLQLCTVVEITFVYISLNPVLSWEYKTFL